MGSDPIFPIDISEQRGVRYLHFGTPWVQGAMRIARPYALELEYTRDLMVPLLLQPDDRWPASILQVGLGSASVTRFLYRFRPSSRLTVVEIAPAVVAAARRYFRLPEDERRIEIVIGDGHEHMAKGHRPFDLIVVDGYDGKGRAGMLDTLPFYCACRARLSEDGFVAVNLLARRRGAKPSIERLSQAFEGNVLVLAPSEAGNVVAIASRADAPQPTFAALRSAAIALKTATGLDLRPALARIAAASSARGDRLRFGT